MDTLEREGLPRDRAYRVVRLVSSKRRVLIRTFQEKVLGLGSANMDKPVQAAAFMGVSFVLGAVLPLLAYIFGGGYALHASVVAAAAALFGVGMAKAHFAKKTRWISGLEFLGVAMGAAAAGYLIGLLLPELGRR